MIRYAILYFVILIVFAALIAGPVVAGRFLDTTTFKLPMELLQPVGLNNNDTLTSVTGSCVNGLPCPGPGGSAAETSSSGSRRLARYLAF